jgi:hypothetical protein
MKTSSKVNSTNNTLKVKILPQFTNKIMDDYYQFIVAALSLVVALSWNSAFQNFFQQNKYLHLYGPWAYALLVTLIVIIIVYVFDLVKENIYIDLNNNNIPDIII